ncbi:MAG: hypothetical protein M3081_15545 [Gemmatimonadota bacterium]|nr:hypothetical protein [Gemmatimonadota bacterium]
MTAPSSAPFTASLRRRAAPIRIGASGDAPVANIRVEIPELWDVVLVEAPLSEPVLAVKNAALAVLDPRADQRDYVMKLRGFEMLDESRSLAESGAVDGSIFLLTRRRRRATK